MRTLVVAASVGADSSALARLAESAQLIIAADGGAALALAAGIRPHVVVGDMDSLSAELADSLRRNGVEIRTFPSRKDETDLELALLEAIRRGAEEITIVGALGGRLDHTLGNVYLLTMPQLRGKDVRLVDGRVEAFVVWGRAEIRGGRGDTVSLIPLTPEVRGVQTEGLEYPLRRESLFMGPGRGISNVLLGPVARVSTSDGILLVVVTHGEEEGDAVAV
ncbi:MAG: thiamine diphosphokinase [Chloroflexi bacterium]|nr:thiamine diphosphokinase [Chloroflexota bacterium]